MNKQIAKDMKNFQEELALLGLKYCECLPPEIILMLTAHFVGHLMTFEDFTLPKEKVEKIVSDILNKKPSDFSTVGNA